MLVSESAITLPWLRRKSSVQKWTFFYLLPGCVKFWQPEVALYPQMHITELSAQEWWQQRTVGLPCCMRYSSLPCPLASLGNYTVNGSQLPLAFFFLLAAGLGMRQQVPSSVSAMCLPVARLCHREGRMQWCGEAACKGSARAARVLGWCLCPVPKCVSSHILVVLGEYPNFLGELNREDKNIGLSGFLLFFPGVVQAFVFTPQWQFIGQCNWGHCLALSLSLSSSATWR